MQNKSIHSISEKQIEAPNLKVICCYGRCRSHTNIHHTSRGAPDDLSECVAFQLGEVVECFWQRRELLHEIDIERLDLSYIYYS